MPARPRFLAAVLAAAALHAGILALLAGLGSRFVAPVPLSPVGSVPDTWISIELEPDGIRDRLDAQESLASTMPPARDNLLRAIPRIPGTHNGSASSSDSNGESSSILSIPQTPGATDGWSISPRSRTPSARPSSTVDLGVGPTLSWRLLESPSRQRDPGVVQGEATAGGLKAALDDHDREIGLGRGGAIVSQLENAARMDSAPVQGKALLEVTVDTRGSVWVGVSQSNHPGWTRVANQLAKQLRGSRFRIPPGARGLRFRVEVDAKVVEYDGSKAPPPVKLEASPGKLGANGILEKMPGLYLSGGGRVCQYNVGLIPIPNQPLNLAGWCDPTKLAVKAQRMVSARVVGETRL